MPRVNFTADFAIIRRTSGGEVTDVQFEIHAEHPTTEIVHQKGVKRAPAHLYLRMASSELASKNFPLSISVFESNEQWDYLMWDIESLKVMSKATEAYVHFVWFCCSTPHIMYNTLPRVLDHLADRGASL